MKLSVKRDEIKETINSEKPSFDSNSSVLNYRPGQTRTLTNSLGFIPAVEAYSTMRSTGMDATGDFDWLAEHIVVHDDLVKNIRTNIHFFETPLVSSRPKHDLIELEIPRACAPRLAPGWLLLCKSAIYTGLTPRVAALRLLEDCPRSLRTLSPLIGQCF